MHTFKNILPLHLRKRSRDGHTALDENAMMAATATATATTTATATAQDHGLTVLTLLVTGFQALAIGLIRQLNVLILISSTKRLLRL